GLLHCRRGLARDLLGSLSPEQLFEQPAALRDAQRSRPLPANPRARHGHWLRSAPARGFGALDLCGRSIPAAAHEKARGDRSATGSECAVSGIAPNDHDGLLGRPTSLTAQRRAGAIGSQPQVCVWPRVASAVPWLESGAPSGTAAGARAWAAVANRAALGRRRPLLLGARPSRRSRSRTPAPPARACA